VSGKLPFGENGFAPGTPLAERMRPRALDEIAGQEALVGPTGVLRQLLTRGELPSLVFWGPPGSGKTTLARVLASACKAEFVSFSAVLSGVKEARAVMDGAKRLRAATGRRTVLFVDEVHRFNKAQQDAFLPFVESGDIVLIGATTENPSFELNAALLSRVKVYVLDPLGDGEIRSLLALALHDAERGLADWHLAVDEQVLAEIARLADGDARVAYNLLEVAAEATGRGGQITADLVRRVAQRKLAKYDKEGEEHYNLISALHKSVRNSDPDASLYWLARMIESGEDPLYLARRMVRMASEDIGLAEPGALAVALAAKEAFDFIGPPEGYLALAQAAVYLSLAPKSNALYTAYGEVLDDVRKTEAEPVPLHLRNAVTGLMSHLGYGEGYKYAHNFEEKVTDMSCLPENLAGRAYYKPTDQGFEQRLKQRLEEIRKIHTRRKSAP
jgi:putative ATPase